MLCLTCGDEVSYYDDYCEKCDEHEVLTLQERFDANYPNDDEGIDWTL